MYYRTEIINNGFKYIVHIYHYKYKLGLYPSHEYLKIKEEWKFLNRIRLTKAFRNKE